MLKVHYLLFIMIITIYSTLTSDIIIQTLTSTKAQNYIIEANYWKVLFMLSAVLK